MTTISSTGIPCRSASCWRRASRSAAMRPMTRWAVPNCCIIILRWRFRAPSAGLLSAPLNAAAASSCFLRARFAVRVPRFGFFPERLMTRASAAAAEASEAGGEPSASLSIPALAELRGSALFSARGALGRPRRSFRATCRSECSDSACPFDPIFSPASARSEPACPAGSFSSSVSSRRVLRARRGMSIRRCIELGGVSRLHHGIRPYRHLPGCLLDVVFSCYRDFFSQFEFLPDRTHLAFMFKCTEVNWCLSRNHSLSWFAGAGVRNFSRLARDVTATWHDSPVKGLWCCQ